MMNLRIHRGKSSLEKHHYVDHNYHHMEDSADLPRYEPRNPNHVSPSFRTPDAIRIAAGNRRLHNDRRRVCDVSGGPATCDDVRMFGVAAVVRAGVSRSSGCRASVTSGTIAGHRGELIHAESPGTSVPGLILTAHFHLPAQQTKPAGEHHQTGVVMEAAPRSPLEVVQPQLLEEQTLLPPAFFAPVPDV